MKKNLFLFLFTILLFASYQNARAAYNGSACCSTTSYCVTYYTFTGSCLTASPPRCSVACGTAQPGDCTIAPYATGKICYVTVIDLDECAISGGTWGSWVNCHLEDNGLCYETRFCSNVNIYQIRQCTCGSTPSLPPESCSDSCNGYQLVDYNNDCVKNSSSCGGSTRYTGGECSVCPLNNNSCSSKYSGNTQTSGDCVIAGCMWSNGDFTVKNNVSFAAGSGATLTAYGKIIMQGGTISLANGYILSPHQ